MQDTAPGSLLRSSRQQMHAQIAEANLWELRAAASLARFWHDQEKRGQAADLLTPICAWFTEGFDTPDPKEAKVLLDELEGA